MDLSTVKNIRIPEGNVVKIVSGGVTLWEYDAERTPDDWEDAKSRFPNYMIAEVVTTSANQSVKICRSTPSYLFVDGAKTAPNTTIAFPSAGTHAIVFVFDGADNSLSYLFEDAKIKTLDITHFDMSGIAYIDFMFNRSSIEEVVGWNSADWSYLGIHNGIAFNAFGSHATFQSASKLKNISIPPTMTRVDSFMFNHCSSAENTEVIIPASVTKIGGSHAFYDCGKDNVFTRFVVESGNTTFKAINGILYSMDGTELVAIPRSPSVTNRTYEMPEGVTKLGELCFNRTQSIDKVVLANSYVIDRYCKGQRDNTGLNYGNSLSVAIYRYTSVKEYAVKSGNTRYSVYDGCIYSADGTELIAVPYRKNGAFSIRSGCTTIGREAFWAASDVTPQPDMTSIHVPASVTSIESAQLEWLNRFIASGKTVTVDSGNTKYMISGGKVVSI